jgi:hypothetical protein
VVPVDPLHLRDTPDANSQLRKGPGEISLSLPFSFGVLDGRVHLAVFYAGDAEIVTPASVGQRPWGVEYNRFPV